MSKPPHTTPHSDIDGVHEDEQRNVDTATETGQDSGDLARANRQSVARPDYDNTKASRDDRSR